MTEATSQLVACPQCGHKVWSNTTVCPACGYRFSATELSYLLHRAAETTKTIPTRVGQSLVQFVKMLAMFFGLTVVYWFVFAFGFGVYEPRPPAAGPSTPPVAPKDHSEQAMRQYFQEVSQSMERSMAQSRYDEWHRKHPTLDQDAPLAFLTLAAFLSALSLFGYRRLKAAKRASL